MLSAVKEYAGRKICVLTSTKALLVQTKKRIQQISKGIFSKVVVHPEMYNPNDTSCLAVLTQERLLRIFKKDPSLSFDCIIVDEAHEILEENSRSRTLANVIIIAQKRNPDVAFKFLTPFLTDSKNLKARYTTYDIEGFKVTEYIKTEKYYLYDLRNHTGLKLYDQFLNRYLPLSENRNLGFEEDVVKAYSAGKNIIYLNKPTDIEKFALALADVLPEMDSEMIQTACDNISNYLQPQYNLLACLRKGIIYHHGSVPDAIRIYIEDLYKKDDSVKYVITSSTLLSGVNLPAERMFILDNKRGRSNLSHDSFKNLVGRVCRFSEIFNDETGNLQRLEPQIYLVFGKYFAQNANCESFLRNVAKVEQNYKDAVDNVLLSEAKITTMNEEELRHASEFIENYENGVVEDYQERYTSTVSGKACIMNGITELDIFAHEAAIQQQVNGYQSENLKISDSNTLLETIYELFIQYLPDNGAESLKRLENQEARNFYSMMFEWRVENKSYAEMINLFVGYWQQLYKKDKNVIVYVGKWGDVKRSGSNVARYTKIFGKDRTQLINLAIVRIKEEQDFIDNTLIKYVEVLYDLELIEDNFYARIKYGTDDERAICLIKNGLSLSSAVLLIKKYNSYLQINVSSSTVVFDDALISEMKKENENQILIYEVQNCM
ncbi:MAG: DEAD/DEAH box helicase family protein [Mediterraneibacter faecis]